MWALLAADVDRSVPYTWSLIPHIRWEGRIEECPGTVSVRDSCYNSKTSNVFTRKENTQCYNLLMSLEKE
jgi:hypothetical protein